MFFLITTKPQVSAAKFWVKMPKMLSAEMILQSDVFQQKGKPWYVVDSIVGIQNSSQPSCKMAFLSQRMKRIQSPLILYSPDFDVASVLNSLSRAWLVDKKYGGGGRFPLLRH